jgi:ABC-type multidrug transport system ATPase subunit
LPAISVEGLHHTYRARRHAVPALRGLDLEVPRGGVFGLLGPNGAGKTTLIRALVGHLRAERGRLRLLDAEVPHHLTSVVDRFGAIVEQPGFFPGFSARRNLSLLARSRGLPVARVDRVLDSVGLLERADSRFATYSLGMKQRLAVASVLLKDPELLILDEPANGLDPPGIREMRELLRALGAEGRTVFVSSHLLHEIEQTCDRVAILDRGRLVATGSVDEILRAETPQHHVRVPGDPAVAARVLADAGYAVVVDDGRLTIDDDGSGAQHVTKILADHGIYLTELRPVDRNLEDAFLEITGRAGDAGPPEA